MIRQLLASTALAGLLATSAIAQGSPPQPTQTSATAGQATGTYVQRLEADQYLASRLTGANVYESDASDAPSIGDIRNFVVGQDGKIAAVVIATSNLEENKTIAAPIDKIEWVAGGDDGQRAIFRGNGTELQGAPVFTAQSPQEAASNGAVLPGSGAGSPTGGTADASAGNVTAAPTANTEAAAANPAAQTTPAPANSADMPSANGYLAALGTDQKLSQDIIGSNVYSGPGDDAQTIGSVNDLVLTKAGAIPAVVVGVGGFLGIGEKNVGVPYAELNVQSNGSDEPRLIMAATRDQLGAAPGFDEGDTALRSAATDAAPAGGAPGGAAMPGDAGATARNAMAPSNADTSTTASTGGGNDRSSMQPISGPELTADALDGASVYGPNDQSIGKVGDIAMATDGRVDAVVVDVGGFLGLGSKPVAVAMDNLQFMRDTNGTVNIYTQFTADQLKNAPEFNRESYAQNRSTMRLQPGDAPAPAGDATGGTGTAGGNQTAQ